MHDGSVRLCTFLWGAQYFRASPWGLASGGMPAQGTPGTGHRAGPAQVRRELSESASTGCPGISSGIRVSPTAFSVSTRRFVSNLQTSQSSKAPRRGHVALRSPQPVRPGRSFRGPGPPGQVPDAHPSPCSQYPPNSDAPSARGRQKGTRQGRRELSGPWES